MSEKIHNWDPFSAQEICKLLPGLMINWGIAGGYAIEIFIGRKIRDHGDVDVVLAMSDQFVIQENLPGWDLFNPVSGKLEPWNYREFLKGNIHDIWCQPG